jgi:hypothetical protein
VSRLLRDCERFSSQWPRPASSNRLPKPAEKLTHWQTGKTDVPFSKERKRGPTTFCVDSDSSVGIATRYGLGGPDIESQWGEIFCTGPNRPWGPPNIFYNGYRVSFHGVRLPGRGVDHPPSFSAEVKERVQLYIYSPSGPSRPVTG